MSRERHQIASVFLSLSRSHTIKIYTCIGIIILNHVDKEGGKKKERAKQRERNSSVIYIWEGSGVGMQMYKYIFMQRYCKAVEEIHLMGSSSDERCVSSFRLYLMTVVVDDGGSGNAVRTTAFFKPALSPFDADDGFSPAVWSSVISSLLFHFLLDLTERLVSLFNRLIPRIIFALEANLDVLISVIYFSSSASVDLLNRVRKAREWRFHWSTCLFGIQSLWPLFQIS